jgi:hypothetical protein
MAAGQRDRPHKKLQGVRYRCVHERAHRWSERPRRVDLAWQSQNLLGRPAKTQIPQLPETAAARALRRHEARERRVAHHGDPSGHESCGHRPIEFWFARLAEISQRVDLGSLHCGINISDGVRQVPDESCKG